MTRAEKVDLLLEFEKNTEICDIKYSNVAVYPYVRNVIFDKIFYNENAPKNLVTNAVKNYFIDEEKLISSLETEVDVVLVSFWRHEFSEGNAYDKITNRYKEELIASDKKFVEIIIGFRGETQISDEHSFYITDLNILKSKKLDVSNLSFPILDELTKLLDIDIKENELLTAVSAAFFEYNYYKKVFAKIKAKQLVTVTSYMRPTIVTAAKDLGIPTVEIEYAALMDYHRGYYFKGHEYPFVSDYFLAWNSTYANNEDLPSNIKKRFVYGKEFKKTNEEKDVYLFISQYGLTKLFIEKAILFKKTFPEKNVVFRFHPNEKRDFTETLYENNIIVDNYSLHDSLSRSIACFGSFSTALFEAKSYGANVYIIDTSDIYYIESYIHQNIFSVLTDVTKYEYKEQKDFVLWEKGEDVFGQIPLIPPILDEFNPPIEWYEMYDSVFHQMKRSGRILSITQTDELLLSIIKSDVDAAFNYSIINSKVQKNIEIVSSKDDVSPNAKYVLDANDLKIFYLNSLDIVVTVLEKINSDALICNNLYNDRVTRSKFRKNKLDFKVAQKLSNSFCIIKNNVEEVKHINIFANILGIIEINDINFNTEDIEELISFVNQSGNKKIVEQVFIQNNISFTEFVEKNSEFVITLNHQHHIKITNKIQVARNSLNITYENGTTTYSNDYINPKIFVPRRVKLLYNVSFDQNRIIVSTKKLYKILSLLLKILMKCKRILRRIFKKIGLV